MKSIKVGDGYMSCKFSHKDILGYIDHELPEKKHRSFAAHLDSCQRCRKAIDLMNAAEAHTSCIAEPDPQLTETVMRNIRSESPRKQKGLFAPIGRMRPSGILVSTLAVIMVIALLAAFWSPLTAGITRLITQKYEKPDNGRLSVGSSVNSPAQEPMSTPVSQPAVPPPDVSPVPGDTPGFAIYKASVSLMDIYNDYTDLQDSDHISWPYESIHINDIPVEEEPLITDADINTYYNGTLCFKNPDLTCYDSTHNRCMSASPVPIIITVDGKRVAWGTFMHPMSSMIPPRDAFLLTFYLQDEQDPTVSYFKLTTSDPERASALEKLMSSYFSNLDRVRDKAEAPDAVIALDPFSGI